MSGLQKKRTLEYREFLTNLAKKRKGVSGSASEKGNSTSQNGCEKLGAISSREGNCKNHNIKSQQLRKDSNIKSQPHSCSTLNQGGVMASSSTDMHLNGKTPVEKAEGNTVAKDVLPEQMLSVESGSVRKCNGEVASNVTVQTPQDQQGTPRFVEYWVPVDFSHLQLEKYCETLIKNRIVLSSSSKHGLVDLNDVLTSTQECCDHPYILDSSLQNFLNDERPMAGILTTGIEASGKLLLLEKFLQDVKRKGLRVVIVFQSNNTKLKSIQLRHLLDDFMLERFGEESYVHIYKDYDCVKKRAACDLFNDGKGGKFVMLMEKSSCQPSVKLCSVDLVILFNSDWSPINDMKCLRKMSIQPRLDHLIILRLYSPNSVEEKVLCLAKEGTVLDSSMQTISRSTSHMLLLWGASYLFSKLDEFHSHCTSIADLVSVSEDKLVPDVLNELLMLLSCKDGNSSNYSFISKVADGNDDYPATISLHGEQNVPNIDDDVPAYAIWSSLLDGKHPQWRLLPVSAPSTRKRGDFCTSLQRYAEIHIGDDKSTSKTTSCVRDKSLKMRKRGTLSTSLLHNVENGKANGMITSAHITSKRTPQVPSESLFQKSRSRSRKASRLGPESRPSKSADQPNPSGLGNEPSSCKDGYNCTSQIEETCRRRMRELLLKQKMEIRDFYRTKRDEKAKLEEEHKLELDLINQGCREAVAKQEVLRKLDGVYEQKLAEHNSQMDMKRKQLEIVQLASRRKEKELKDKWIALSKKNSFNGSISSLVAESLLDSDLGAETAEATEIAVDAVIMVSDPAQCSESKHSEVIEQGSMEELVQNFDPVGTPDCSVAETEILSVESDGENDAASMPREEEWFNFINHEGDPFLHSNTVSNSVSLVDRQSQDHPALNNEVEGNSSTNMESSKEILLGVAVEKHSIKDSDHDSNFRRVCSPSGPLESDGENDVLVCGEDLECRSNLGALNEHQLFALSGVNQLNSLANLPNEEVQHKNHTTQTSSEEINGKGASDSFNTSDVLGQDPTELPLPVVTRSDQVQEQPQDGHPLNNSTQLEQAVGPLTLSEATRCALSGQNHMESLSNLPNREELDGEGNIGASSEEIDNGGAARLVSTPTVSVPQSRDIDNGGAAELVITPTMSVSQSGEIDDGGAAELVITPTASVPQSVPEQEPTEFASSRIISGDVAMVDSQIGAAQNISLPLEQPVGSVCLPTNEIRECAGASLVPHGQTSGIHGSLQLYQNSSPSRNPGLSYRPYQSCDEQEPTHVPSAGGRTMMLTSNSFPPESPSLRANMVQSTGLDVLDNELMRIKKEEEEAVKIHGEKLLFLQSACQKEMDEIRKKYDLLRQAVYVELQQKKVALESACRKVLSHKILAETWRYHNQRARSPPSSQEALSRAILELPIMRQHNAPAPRTAATTLPPAASHVQVVHQLSDLISSDPMRSQNSSPLYSNGNGNSSFCYTPRSTVPHLRQYGSLYTPMTTPSTSLVAALPSQRCTVYGSETSLPGSSWPQHILAPVVLRQPDGTHYNPVVL